MAKSKWERSALGEFYKYRSRRDMDLQQYALLLGISSSALSNAERELTAWPEHAMRALCAVEGLNFDAVAAAYESRRQQRRSDMAESILLGQSRRGESQGVSRSLATGTRTGTG